MSFLVLHEVWKRALYVFACADAYSMLIPDGINLFYDWRISSITDFDYKIIYYYLFEKLPKKCDNTLPLIFKKIVNATNYLKLFILICRGDEKNRLNRENKKKINRENRTEKKKPIKKFRKNSGLVRFQFCNAKTG
jgi:hypothetical protein